MSALTDQEIMKREEDFEMYDDTTQVLKQVRNSWERVRKQQSLRSKLELKVNIKHRLSVNECE